MTENPSPANSIPERAKQLYTYYCGNSFFMDREGDYEEYKQYNVPSDLESQWRAERIETLISQLTPDDRDTVIALSIWKAKEALPQLIQLAEGEDDHARLIRANTLWELATCPKPKDAPDIEPTVEQTAMALALETWAAIAEASTLNVVDKTWRPWDGNSPEDFLRNWARRNLEDARSGRLRI
jgi:hypothetical protein